jgi:hypothetical protein
MGKISTAEVLRLRAASSVSRNQSVRRLAQDDDSVGGPKEKQHTSLHCASLRSSEAEEPAVSLNPVVNLD